MANRRQMRRWKRIGMKGGIWGWAMGVGNLLGQTLLWHGTPQQWTANSLPDSVLQLSMAAPGSAWLYTCPATSGGRVSWDWSTTFAGSQNNFSAVHLFNLPPGIAAGDAALDSGPPPVLLSMRVGEAGSSDGLQITTGWDGDGDGNANSVHSGALADPFGLRCELQWPPGDSCILSASVNPGTDPMVPAADLPWGNPEPPECIGFSATVTSSNLSGVTFQLRHWTPWAPDLTPPQFVHAQCLTADSVLWVADEALADNGGDWRWTEVLAEPAEPGIPFWASAPAVADLSGNIAAPDSAFLVLTDASQHAPGHLVVAEILADPTPSTFLPPEEWVEVVNVSSFSLQIRDLTWYDIGSGLSSIEPLPPWDGVLHSGERAVLTTSDDELFVGVKQAVLPDGGALTDAGDEVGLLLPGSALEWSDRVAWDNDLWDEEGGDGRSWQRLFLKGCAGPANWVASTAPTGATPGNPGWLESDGDGPEAAQPVVTAVLPRSLVDVEIHCDAPMDPWSLNDLPTGWSGTLGGEDPAILFLRCTTSRPNGRLSGLQTCFGPRRKVEWDWPERLGRFAEQGDVALTEIMAAPLPGSPGGSLEWVEIQNITADTLDITGLQINGTQRAERTALAPHARWVWSFGGPHDLPNARGEVVVRTHAGAVVDSVSYNPCFYSRRTDENSGRSMVRAGRGRSSHWSTSGHLSGASPGFEDPRESNDHPDFAGAPTWQLCGRTVGLDAPVVLWQTPVNMVDDLAQPLDLEGVEARRVWALNRTVPFGDWPTLKATTAKGDTVECTAPEHCAWEGQLSTEAPREVLLNEVLAETPVQPFVELDVGSEPVWTGDFAVSTDDSFWSPEAQHPLTSSGVNWLLPAHQTWAFAACPNRLNADQVLPWEDMPSFWANPLVALLQTGANPAFLCDTVQLSDGRHAAWLADAEGVSLERCGAMGWTSCREPLGHSAGEVNATFGWCDGSPGAISHARLASPYWRPGGPPLQAFWCSTREDCIPTVHLRAAWSMREVAAFNSANPNPHDPECLQWTWEGESTGAAGVPPAGAYLVEWRGCPETGLPWAWAPLCIEPP